MSPNRSGITLALCTLLHALTHALGSMLVPLYLLMRDDLRRSGVKEIALIVTVYGVVYALLSYPAGILADRMNRKMLLGIGLIGNALAVTLMGLTHRYEMLLLLGVMGGMFGSLFHPTANALVPAHFPKNPGMPIGIMGIGSGLGFFFGPQYAGWRAEAAGWQRPCLELGLLGVVVGILFLILAKEAHAAREVITKTSHPLGKGMRRKVLAIAAILGCRDFAGIATASLVSIYLQKAHGFDARHTGWVVGAMMLSSMVANPIAVWLSPGHRRLPALMINLLIGGVLLVLVPRINVAWVLAMLAVFQIFHLGSYAIGEAAMLERVHPDVRGRVIGMFLTSAGTFASLSPWVIGFWTDLLGPRALRPEGYYIPFAVLGAMMVFAGFSVKMIARLGPAPQVSGPEALQAISPTMEAIG
ncbi:MAG TPA: MFS transporter [Tepidisphaeraceae bacterium]|nr:MFS transporter [Tepidisphaeraceae bacterium]